MARMPPSTFSRCILYWWTCHLLLRFLCLHEAAILALLVVILLTRFLSIFLGLPLHLHFGDCSSRTLFSELWSAMEYRARVLSRAMTRTVSVLSIWVFHMHAMRFMGCQNVHFVKTSISNPSAWGFWKGVICVLRCAPEASAAFRESVSLQIGLCVYAWRPTAETSTSY